MSIVEAIQVKLLGREGYILWPTRFGGAPKIIDDMELMYESPRVFDRCNPNGPVYRYEFDGATNRWVYLDFIHNESDGS